MYLNILFALLKISQMYNLLQKYVLSIFKINNNLKIDIFRKYLWKYYFTDKKKFSWKLFSCIFYLLYIFLIYITFSDDTRRTLLAFIHHNIEGVVMKSSGSNDSSFLEIFSQQVSSCDISLEKLNSPDSRDEFSGAIWEFWSIHHCFKFPQRKLLWIY